MPSKEDRSKSPLSFWLFLSWHEMHLLSITGQTFKEKISCPEFENKRLEDEVTQAIWKNLNQDAFKISKSYIIFSDNALMAHCESLTKTACTIFSCSSMDSSKESNLEYFIKILTESPSHIGSRFLEDLDTQ